MPLSSRFVLRAYGLQTGTAPTPDLGTATGAQVTIDQLTDITLADGTAAGQADRMFEDTRTLSASANEDLDLAGVLTDRLGNTITFARVKGLYIAASAANTNNVVVGAAASNQWATLLNTTGTLQIKPGAAFLYRTGALDATGHTVTAGTGDLLRITNGGAGTSVTYDIIIIGCSA